MRLWNILSFVILGILSLVQGEDTRGTADKAATDFYYHIFEAEEFGNLPFYGNWYSKPDLGWYIKEHRHASGRAFVVCDELNINSVMTKRMESPLAPGDLKLFVRVALMRPRSARGRRRRRRPRRVRSPRIPRHRHRSRQSMRGLRLSSRRPRSSGAKTGVLTPPEVVPTPTKRYYEPPRSLRAICESWG